MKHLWVAIESYDHEGEAFQGVFATAGKARAGFALKSGAPWRRDPQGTWVRHLRGQHRDTTQEVRREKVQGARYPWVKSPGAPGYWWLVLDRHPQVVHVESVPLEGGKATTLAAMLFDIEDPVLLSDPCFRGARWSGPIAPPPLARAHS